MAAIRSLVECRPAGVDWDFDTKPTQLGRYIILDNEFDVPSARGEIKNGEQIKTVIFRFKNDPKKRLKSGDIVCNGSDENGCPLSFLDESRLRELSTKINNLSSATKSQQSR